VLVARQDNDGDVLLAGPAVRAIAAGAREVTLVCGPRGEQAARLLPGVDRVLAQEAAWIDADPGPVERAGVDAFVDRVAGLHADMAVILTSFHQSPLPTALLLRAAGVPFVGAISEDYPGSLLDVRHRVADELHEVRRGLSLAVACGFPLPESDGGRLRVRPTAATPPPQGLPDSYVVVHPGASVPARAWGGQRNAELVDALVAVGRSVVVTGGPEETELAGRVAGDPRDAVVNLAGTTTLAQLAAVLAGADAIVVGNTGPAHLAAAVGTPVVSLFAPTVPAARWRPWGVAHELLSIDVPCAGCRARVCPVDGHPCLSGVTAAQALAAVDRLSRSRVAA